MLSDLCNQGLRSSFGVDSTGLSDQPQSGTHTSLVLGRNAALKSEHHSDPRSNLDGRELRRRPPMAPFHSKASDQSIKSAKQRLRKGKRQSGYVGKARGAAHSRAVVSCGSAICKAKHSQGKMGRGK